MNWYKKAQHIYEGFKVVGFNQGSNQFYSIYDKSPYDVSIGKEVRDPNGFYLGSTKQFCTDYYICMTEDDHDEYILTFSYGDEDLMRGEPNNPNTEVLVSRGTITGMERVDKEGLC